MATVIDDTAAIIDKYHPSRANVLAVWYMTLDDVRAILQQQRPKLPLNLNLDAYWSYITDICRDQGLGYNVSYHIPRPSDIGKSEKVLILPLAERSYEINSIRFTSEGIQFKDLPAPSRASCDTVRKLLGAGDEEDVTDVAALYDKTSEMEVMEHFGHYDRNQLVQKILTISSKPPKDAVLSMLRFILDPDQLASWEAAMSDQRERPEYQAIPAGLLDYEA